MSTIIVRKASGESVPYDKDKLTRSLQRSGADNHIIKSIVSKIEDVLYDGISTAEIYRIAYNLLDQKRHAFSGRYHLKKALFELGPSGFPFEKYISALLQSQGYTVSTGKIVAGKCVSHEIDIIAEKENRHFMIECKFHHSSGIPCDVKVPLYIEARFRDVEAQWKLLPGHGMKFHQGWLVTNTRFTADAITYGTCSGLHLLGWNYPETENLRALIDNSGLYPLTCLRSLTASDKSRLLANGVVLCREILDQPDVLYNADIPAARHAVITEECNKLCALHQKQEVI
jgi:hypothetical protein